MELLFATAAIAVATFIVIISVIVLKSFYNFSSTNFDDIIDSSLFHDGTTASTCGVKEKIQQHLKQHLEQQQHHQQQNQHESHAKPTAAMKSMKSTYSISSAVDESQQQQQQQQQQNHH